MTERPAELANYLYKRHRFPAEVIAHAVWLYFRLPLSLRHVEDLLAARGIEVSFQTVAEWAGKFGGEYARRIRRMSKGAFADKWHLDEMVGTSRRTSQRRRQSPSRLRPGWARKRFRADLSSCRPAQRAAPC